MDITSVLIGVVVGLVIGSVLMFLFLDKMMKSRKKGMIEDAVKEGQAIKKNKIKAVFPNRIKKSFSLCLVNLR